jgi:protein HIRA/HIR1
VSLSNGTVVTYDQTLASWTQLTSAWWTKGSEHWENRVRNNNATGRGVVKIIESETNDFIAAQSDMITTEGDEARLRPSIEGEEQKKLGNDDDWKMALTLGHLEARMNAAIALDSLSEYKMFLNLYAKRLADEAFRGKAEELIRDLMGPIY